jgi:hypothetical protein
MLADFFDEDFSGEERGLQMPWRRLISSSMRRRRSFAWEARTGGVVGDVARIAGSVALKTQGGCSDARMRWAEKARKR